MKQGWWVLVCLAMLVPAMSFASIPDAENSTTPDCIAICPDGDICQTMIIRDQNNNPMPDTEVRMVFNAACEDQICVCPGQDYPVVTGTTNAAGEVTFCINAGGCCEVAGAVIIEADPGSVVLNSYDAIASPDMHSDAGGAPLQAGDCDVDLNDFVYFASIFLTDNCCGNLIDDDPNDGTCDDCVINLNDFVGFAVHFLHVCP